MLKQFLLYNNNLYIYKFRKDASFIKHFYFDGEIHKTLDSVSISVNISGYRYNFIIFTDIYDNVYFSCRFYDNFINNKNNSFDFST